MKLSVHNSPYIRLSESSRTLMGDAIIALAPLYFMAYFYYGQRVFAVAAISILTCVIADWFSSLLINRRINPRDLSPIITGMIISLMLPAVIDYSVVVTAGIFAIIIAKAPFGGTGNNLFNPAAAGIAFVIISWPEKLFGYTQPLEHLPLIIDDTVKIIQGPAATLKLGGAPSITATELLLGNFPGAMGATNALIILACFAYLVARKGAKWYVPLAYLVTAGLIAAVAHPFGVSMAEAVCYELNCGSLLFVGVFMLSDPVTSPKRNLAKVFYGAAAGIITMMFRYFGAVEQSAVFALLFINAISPAFDNLAELLYKIHPQTDKKKIILSLKEKDKEKGVASIAPHQKS